MKLKCGGISIFPSNELIVYIPIVVSERLINFHKELYDNLIIPVEKEIHNNSFYYFPDNWVPHITLIQYEKNKDITNEMLTKILEINNNYEFEVNNLALLDNTGKIFFEF